VTAGGSSVPEVHALLRVLAAGRRAAEVGTAYGEGAAAIAETAGSLVTVEIDPERAAAARLRLAGFPHVEAFEGDWREVLPPRAPFELLFWDGGGWKGEPQAGGAPAVELLVPGGLLVSDDFTPGRSIESDPARQFLFGHPQLATVEVTVSPEMAVIVAARTAGSASSG
jgi:predicted O-methyltransferase YrrM